MRYNLIHLSHLSHLFFDVLKMHHNAENPSIMKELYQKNEIQKNNDLRYYSNITF